MDEVVLCRARISHTHLVECDHFAKKRGNIYLVNKMWCNNLDFLKRVSVL